MTSRWMYICSTRTLLSLLGVVGISQASPAQQATETGAQMRIGAEVGAVVPVTWARGDGAPTVTSNTAPVLALRAGWQTSPSVRAGMMLRTSSGSVSLKENGETWKGGSLTLSDVVATLSFRRPASRLTFEAGAGYAFIAGADNVAPFDGASPGKPVGEISIGVDIPQRFTARPIAIVARGSFMRVGAATLDDAVTTTGYVSRFGLALRVGR